MTPEVHVYKLYGAYSFSAFLQSEVSVCRGNVKRLRTSRSTAFSSLFCELPERQLVRNDTCRHHVRSSFSTSAFSFNLLVISWMQAGARVATRSLVLAPSRVGPCPSSQLPSAALLVRTGGLVHNVPQSFQAAIDGGKHQQESRSRDGLPTLSPGSQLRRPRR